jgi:hypothetical protein
MIGWGGGIASAGAYLRGTGHCCEIATGLPTRTWQDEGMDAQSGPHGEVDDVG